jgi:hypothetical protein
MGTMTGKQWCIILVAAVIGWMIATRTAWGTQ